MKVLAICGSPRNGNTETILKSILDGAKEAGFETELLLLKDKDIKLCGGCSHCQETKTCHLLDDMRQVYPKVFAADILILGSPNYFNNVSALMKNFFDRFSPYWEERLKGKKAVLVSVGTEGRSSLKYPENATKRFCEICRIKIIGKLRVTAEKPHDARQNLELLQKAKALGKKLRKS